VDENGCSDEPSGGHGASAERQGNDQAIEEVWQGIN
jgi:hypothetical protein